MKLNDLLKFSKEELAMYLKHTVSHKKLERDMKNVHVQYLIDKDKDKELETGIKISNETELDFVMKYEDGFFKCKYNSGEEYESVDGENWRKIS